MKRSEINRIFREATACFEKHHWALPPHPKWDVTDFGLADFDAFGLTLVNLAEEPEYCEKLMYARQNQVTPAHTHAVKKEDIICRSGELTLRLWAGKPDDVGTEPCTVNVCGEPVTIASGDLLVLKAGERVTLCPGTYHSFWVSSEEGIIGEVSTANDDAHDNFFLDPNIGRYPDIEEDEPAEVRLLSDD
jgi:D-lyxose ketol-isomerase